MSKSLEEQIKALEAKKKAIEARKRALERRASEAERKARTRRLIQEGGMLEGALKKGGIDDITPDDFPSIEKYLTRYAAALAAWVNHDRKKETKPQPEEDGFWTNPPHF